MKKGDTEIQSDKLHLKEIFKELQDRVSRVEIIKFDDEHFMGFCEVLQSSEAVLGVIHLVCACAYHGVRNVSF